MENLSRDEMKFRQEMAEKELMGMWEKSTMPKMPPFVRAPNGGSFPSGEPSKGPQPDPPPSPPIFAAEPPKKGLGGILSRDIFKFLDLKNFELNSDRMLILLMIVLLSGEDSDNILLFALAYIML